MRGQDPRSPPLFPCINHWLAICTVMHVSNYTTKLFIACCSSATENLRLNYQEVEYNSDQETFQFGFVYDGECDILSVRVVTIDDESFEHMHTKTFTRSVYEDKVFVPGEFITAQTYFRIVATNNGAVCTDYDSNHTFYKIIKGGIVPLSIDILYNIPCSFKFKLMQV